MNHPHDPLFRWLSLVIAFSIGLAVGGWAFSVAPKPVPGPLTEGQLAGAVHAYGRMVKPGMVVDQASYDYMRAARYKAEAGFLEACVDLYSRDPHALRALPPACNYFATSLLAATAKASSRNRQTPAVAVTPFIAPGSIQTAEDFNRHVARVCPRAALPTYQTGDIVPQSDMLRCITHASLYEQPASQNTREWQTLAVTPQPYVLHPDKTPLNDPTQAAYYRKLLEQGRFPVSGSAEGRPR